MKKNCMLRKGLQQRRKWQEGISCQRSEGRSSPGAAHTALDTVILWGSDQGPGAARSEAADQRVSTHSQAGAFEPWFHHQSQAARTKFPTLMRVFFPSVRGFYYLHNAAQRRCCIAWLPAVPKYELSVHICTPGSEWSYVKLKAKQNAWRMKVKTRTEHCNKSEVGPRVCTKLFPDEKGHCHNIHPTPPMCI